MDPDTPLPPESPRAPGFDAAGRSADAIEAARLLEARLVRLENYLGFRKLTAEDADAILSGTADSAPTPRTSIEGELEHEIGEFWLARVGVLALSVGLAFLTAFPFPGLPAIASCLIGYAAAALFFFGSHRWRQTLPDTARILFAGALFLGYFATLRLHFFSARPVVTSAWVGIGALVALLAAELHLTVRRRSEGMTALVFVLGLATAVMADGDGLQLPLMTVLALGATALAWRFGWPWFGLGATAATYFLHLDWLLSHPILGHTWRGVAESHGNLLALAACSVAFAALGCRPGATSDHVAVRVFRALVIGGGVMLVALINAQLFHRAEMPWPELLAAAGLLLAAIVYWRNHQSVYATSLYSCVSNLLITVAIFRLFPAPGCYNWLAWQSLLVAVTAVWFRSKIIVVANVVIFAGIYVAYMALGPKSGPVNLSFAAVALLTARVLNWQKDRLALRTELMRNLYLGAASVFIPYGLYHTVPAGWVSVSWLAAAGLYFGASAVLHSKKYRWMGIGTIWATIAYVFIVDLARLDAAYRIMSFLVLGVVLLAMSIGYARRRRRERPTASPET